MSNSKKSHPRLRRRMIILIITLGVILGLVFGYHAFIQVFLKRLFAGMANPIETVATVSVKSANWQKTLSAVGTLTAVHSVQVSNEVACKVLSINFQSGQEVRPGQKLLQCDDAIDRQALAKSTAQYGYLQSNYDRLKAASAASGVSKDDLARALSDAQGQAAQSGQIKAQIQQKLILAPFAGKIGIRQVEVGQYLAPGTSIANLTSWDPLYVQFSLPEQSMGAVNVGQMVKVHVDARPKQVFMGKIYAIDSHVDTQTHTVMLQAKVNNAKRALFPGSFATVTVLLPVHHKVMVIPQTAVNASLSGSTVFVIAPGGVDKKDHKKYFSVKERMVRMGMRQGPMVSIVSGLKVGDQVVSAGQLKLQNGSRVRINNAMALKETGAS